MQIEGTAGSRLRVVIAEDAPAMRALLRRMLEDSDAFDIVGEAGNGEEAVQLADLFQPDVVLLDVAMPVLDGLAAIPRIRIVSPASRIVVLSAMDADRVSYQALASGADAFIEKRLLSGSMASRVIEACRLPAVRSQRGPQRVDETTLSLAPDSRPPVGDTCDGLLPPAGHAEPGAFRLTFDHAPIGMAVLDSEGRFQDVNEAFCRLVARRPATLVGDRIDEISHPDDIGRHAGLRLHLLRSPGDGSTNPAELRLIRSDGHLTWTMVTWCVRRTGDGSPDGFVAQLVDISERKLAEVTRARAEEMRERHEREMGRSSPPPAGVEGGAGELVIEDEVARRHHRRHRGSPVE